jgi:hypothetical protein
MDVIEVSERANTLAVKHRAKLDALFKGKHYTVLRPIDVGEGKRAYTALGNQCRRGYQLQNDVTGEFIFIGIKVLRQAAAEYHAVVIPKTERKIPEEVDPYAKPSLASLLD